MPEPSTLQYCDFCVYPEGVEKTSSYLVHCDRCRRLMCKLHSDYKSGESCKACCPCNSCRRWQKQMMPFDKHLRDARETVSTWPKWKQEALGGKASEPRPPMSAAEMQELVYNMPGQSKRVKALADWQEKLARKYRREGVIAAWLEFVCEECHGDGHMGQCDDGHWRACENCGGHEDGLGNGLHEYDTYKELPAPLSILNRLETSESNTVPLEVTDDE